MSPRSSKGEGWKKAFCFPFCLLCRCCFQTRSLSRNAGKSCTSLLSICETFHTVLLGVLQFLRLGKLRINFLLRISRKKIAPGNLSLVEKNLSAKTISGKVLAAATRSIHSGQCRLPLPTVPRPVIARWIQWRRICPLGAGTRKHFPSSTFYIKKVDVCCVLDCLIAGGRRLSGELEGSPVWNFLPTTEQCWTHCRHYIAHNFVKPNVKLTINDFLGRLLDATTSLSTLSGSPASKFLLQKLLYSGLHFIQKFATPTLHDDTATFTMDDEDIYSSAPAICPWMTK